MHQDAPILSKDSYLARKENAAESEKGAAQENPQQPPQKDVTVDESKDVPPAQEMQKEQETQKTQEPQEVKETQETQKTHEAQKTQKTQEPQASERQNPSPSLSSSSTAQNASGQSAQPPKQNLRWVSSVSPSQRLVLRKSLGSSLDRGSPQLHPQAPLPSQKEQDPSSPSLSSSSAAQSVQSPMQSPGCAPSAAPAAAPPQKSAAEDGKSASTAQGSGWVAHRTPTLRALQQKQPEAPHEERPEQQKQQEAPHEERPEQQTEAGGPAEAPPASEPSFAPVCAAKIGSPVLNGSTPPSAAQGQRWGGFVKSKRPEKNLGFLTLRGNRSCSLRVDEVALAAAQNPQPQAGNEQAQAPSGGPSIGWKAYHGRSSKSIVIAPGK